MVAAHAVQLGVADEVIADDYELSEAAEPLVWAYCETLYLELAGKRWTHITVSPRRAMLNLLDDLRERHGSIAGYAASVGVTEEHVAALRAHLLTS